jgi:hypothetical protein
MQNLKRREAMIDSASPGSIFFEINELSSGINKGFAGYVGYNKSNDPDFEKEIEKFIKNPGGNDPSKRPTRIGKPGGKHDSSLSILAEPGTNRYAFVPASGARAAFDKNVENIFAIPTIGDFPDNLITDIWRTQIGGTEVGSFLFDTDAAKDSDLAKAVRTSGHGWALKIPFYLNLVDTELGIPLWAIDDFRYHPLHQQTEMMKAGNDDAHIFTHGGIHPPGVASFVIVEL